MFQSLIVRYIEQSISNDLLIDTSFIVYPLCVIRDFDLRDENNP